MRQFKGVSAFSMLADNFPIQRFIKCYPPDLLYPGVGICANRFGVSWGKLGRWCRAFSQRHMVEAHFCSGAARRNRSWDKYDPYPGVTVSEYNKRIVDGTLPNLARKIHKFATGLGGVITDNTKLLVCPELEDNLTNDAFEILLAMFKEEFKSWRPRVQFVRCPCKGGNELFGCYYEVHGRNGTPSNVYNPDGVSVNFHDGEKYFDTMSIESLMKYMRLHYEAKLRLIWVANIQGVGQSSSFNYPPPTQRTFIVTDECIRNCKEILKQI